MVITRKTLQTIAWSTLAISAAKAQYIIDNLSFGHKDTISPNLRAIPHWAANGDGFQPEILSDRVVLTPPWPGNKRGSLWTEDQHHHNGDWTAEVSFRVSGMERGGGNMQIWYTKDSQKDQVPSSLYTVQKFDGLVLTIDQYEGRGGSIRGFLNDGNIDFKAHHSVDTLSFGQCNYAYRNLGRFSEIKLHHANNLFEVTVDGRPCFSTDKIKLPQNYYFGISASSAESPDSFEVQKFIVSTTNSYTREEPNHQAYQQPPQHEQQQHMQQRNQQQQQQQQQKETTLGEIPAMLSDVLAGTIRSQEDQFADLHNRIQIINHRVDLIYDTIQRIEQDGLDRFNKLMNRVMSMDDKTRATMRNVEKVERVSMEVQRDLESKDFKDLLNSVHNAIKDSHNALSTGMPIAMATIVGKERPSMTTFLFIAVAVQVMILGAYLVYKKRRNNAPKKYL